MGFFTSPHGKYAVVGYAKSAPLILTTQLGEIKAKKRFECFLWLWENCKKN